MNFKVKNEKKNTPIRAMRIAFLKIENNRNNIRFQFIEKVKRKTPGD